MNENKTFFFENTHRIKYMQVRIILILTLIVCNSVIIRGQNTNSVNFKMQNNNPFSKHAEDSINKNNPLCQKYSEVVRLDTLYWSQYPKVSLDSIPQLQGRTANEMAKQALDIKSSKYFSNQPFNLIGTYSETEMLNNINSSKNIKTKVRVYDPGFTSNNLVKARTEKYYDLYKSPDISPSVADIWKTSLVGEYSNLYYSLDFDFLRMYNVPFSRDLGGDRRIWSEGRPKDFVYVPDSFKYYKAFKKDSSLYVVLVCTRVYSILDYLNKPNSSLKLNFPKGEKPINSEYKYLLVNLNTNVIEKSGYYRIVSESYNNSLSSYPNIATSYETSYKRIGGQYFLDQEVIYDYRFGPRIDHISLSGISFKVDSVINDPSKVIRIKESEADPRKVNYIDHCISNDIKYKNNGDK